MGCLFFRRLAIHVYVHPLEGTGVTDTLSPVQACGVSPTCILQVMMSLDFSL